MIFKDTQTDTLNVEEIGFMCTYEVDAEILYLH